VARKVRRHKKKSLKILQLIGTKPRSVFDWKSSCRWFDSAPGHHFPWFSSSYPMGGTRTFGPGVYGILPSSAAKLTWRLVAAEQWKGYLLADHCGSTILSLMRALSSFIHTLVF